MNAASGCSTLSSLWETIFTCLWRANIVGVANLWQTIATVSRQLKEVHTGTHPARLALDTELADELAEEEAELADESSDA